MTENRSRSTFALVEAFEPRLLQSGVKSGDKAPLYDFSDAYYLQNGIDPTKIAGRPTGANGSVPAAAPDSDHRGIRMTALNGMHDDGGKPNFFAILGTVNANAFTNNSAGQRARQIADQYIAYIFPKAGSNPLSPAQKRADEVIPLNNGYFSNDPVEIWREAFVNYLPRTVVSTKSQKVYAELARRNGLDSDGTPFLKSVNDIQDAEKAGLVSVTLRANDGSQGARWFFCAVFKDYTHGAIAADNTLTFVHNANGTIPTSEQDIKRLFDQLFPSA